MANVKLVLNEEESTKLNFIKHRLCINSKIEAVRKIIMEYNLER
jgi:hypothetical protein